MFEYVYLARPDADDRAAAACTRPASRWAASWPGSTRSRPTWSSPVPESGTPAAVGYAQESGIPYGQGFVKNAYVGRTFIQPSQTLRQLGIRLKLNPLRDMIRGKRLVVVDDSIVRGNTQRALVRMLREAGALEVHVRISVAAGAVAVLLRHRLRHPGRADRQRARRRGDPARRSAPTRSATSPLEGMVAATDAAGRRPVHGLLHRRLPDRAARATSLIGKHVLETLPITVRTGHDSSIDLLALNP